jgi:cellulose synthase/poly-beta-1,6-N-acetylglucosamine synthase-like glycosyltransferase
MKLPFVTVGIITKNEEQYIEETVNSVLELDYPNDRYEVLIVDGNSKDRTQKIISKIMDNNENVQMIVEPWEKGTHGRARNLLVENSRGKYIAFTDGDCMVSKEWLKTLVSSIIQKQKENLSVVGSGGIRKPVKTTKWKENLINHMISTFFGSGGSNCFMKVKKNYVDSVPTYNSIYVAEILKKERFSELGVGDDYELGLRLNKLGFKIAFEANAIIYHHQEDNFLKFFKQMYQYGNAQVEVFEMTGKLRYFAVVAPLFVLLLIFGLVLSFFSTNFLNVFIGIILIYLSMDLLYTLKLFFNTKKGYSLLSFLIYPVEHLSYGLGVLRGILRWVLSVVKQRGT